MKIDTVFRFDFPFDNYTAVVDGTNTSYELVSSSTGIVVPGAGGMVLITKEALAIGSQVRNLKDRLGTSVLVLNGDEYPMYVTASDPQFNPFNELIGWRHTLRRTLPRDLDATLDRLIASA